MEKRFIVNFDGDFLMTSQEVERALESYYVIRGKFEVEEQKEVRPKITPSEDDLIILIHSLITHKGIRFDFDLKKLARAIKELIDLIEIRLRR